jgi:uncharacterized membrane protein
MEKLLFLKRCTKQEGKTVTIESSKTLGGVGSILLLIGVLPYVSSITFGVLGIVGIILILISLHGLANIYNDKGIFNNSLYGFIAGIVGAVIAAVVAFAVVLSNLTSLLQKIYPTWNGKLSSIQSLSGMTPQTTNLHFSDVVPLLEGLVAVFLILWIFIIIWAIFARKSLKTLSTKSSVGLFSTASLLLIIGAALTIIIIGLLLLWIGVLLMAIAFFQIKPQMEQQPVTYVEPPTQPTPV